MRRCLLVLGALGLMACDSPGSKPGFVVLPGMVYSVPYDSYDTHPEIGKILRGPPEGTVALGAEPFTYGPGPEEAKRAAAELTSPVTGPLAGRDLARAQKIYGTFCSVCHGTGGEGDGPIIGKFPNPPSLLADKARGLPEGQMFHIVTLGQGLMPGHGGQIRAPDRWLAIAYVRRLQEGGAP